MIVKASTGLQNCCGASGLEGLSWRPPLVWSVSTIHALAHPSTTGAPGVVRESTV